MTMDAHGLPIVPSIHSVALPSTSRQEYIASTTTNIVDTVSKIAKEAGEIFKDVPYIKALAGIIIRVIEIREEIQMVKDRSRELIDKILRRSKVILDGLLRIAKSPNVEQLKDIEERLRDYNNLLGKIVIVLQTCASKGVIDRFINRRSRIDELEKYNRLIDDFNTDFVTDLHIQSHLTNVSQRTSTATGMVFYKPVLPPPAELMIGRDKEKHDIVDALLNKMPARLAILGGGGIGKTTLALSTLHSPVVSDRYPSRYFVSCEAVPSVSALVGEVANALRIPPANRDEHLVDVILTSFHGITVLCLDNFETVWDNEGIRSDTEEFLSHLNSLRQLAIIITMRGTQRPSRVSWSKPLLPSLERLSDADSKLIFETICGPVDEVMERLLKEVDGIPLAVTLISALLQEGNETSESLWTRWEQTKTSVVENGGKDRLSNLDKSIHLSVYGPRMQADPNAILILAMLSILPDGFPHSEVAINELQRHMPMDSHLREGLLTLRRVSLVHVDQTSTSHRIRMLAPIRHFCETRLQVPEIFRSRLIFFYMKMLSEFADFTDPAGHAIIPAELRNMHAVLVLACKHHRANSLVIRACILYTEWSLYIGSPVEEVIHLALDCAEGSPRLLGNCHSALARVSLQRSKLDEAEASLQRAIELHRQAHDVLREEDAVRGLGEVYLRRGKLDEAQATFERAIELHRQAPNVCAEACNIRMLGEVYLRRGKLDEAQASFERAIELHRQPRLQDVHGEVLNVQKLGDVDLRRGKLDEAQPEASFERAIELHQQAHDVPGEAYDVQRLGDVYLQQDKLDEARASFERAVELHRQLQNVHGEAYNVQELGDVYFQQDKLDEARASFERAIELHRQVQNVFFEAYNIQKIGNVHLQQDKLDEAHASFEQALEFYRLVPCIFGEAVCLAQLGDLYLQQDKLDKALASFERAIELHRQAHNVQGEASSIRKLGDVYFQQEKLDKAQASFERAIELHRQVRDAHGEAYNVQKLGGVYLQRDELGEAQASFKQALELYRLVHCIVRQANCLQQLGGLYLRQDNLQEAEICLNNALLKGCRVRRASLNGRYRQGNIIFRCTV